MHAAPDAARSHGAGPDPLLALRSLPAIGLPQLDAHAAPQDRVDVKYVVTLAQLAALLERLAATHSAPQIDGRRTFGYRTTYYDTEDMLTFHEHVQQRRRRFKCRRRWYVDSGRSVFEVKLKGARGRTVKHALPCAAGGDLPADEAYGRRLPGILRPALTATFRRSTVAALALGERVTFDLDLDFGCGRLDERLAIVESKSADGAALADQAMRGMGIRPVSGCSKYMLGIALTHAGMRDDDLRPLLRRCFSADPHTARSAAQVA